MKPYVFNKRAYQSELPPRNTKNILWVSVNNDKKITALKEFNPVSGLWEEITLIAPEGSVVPVEIELNTTSYYPAENELLDALTTSGNYPIVHETNDEPSYGTIKVVKEDETVTQEAIYTYFAGTTLTTIHCEREMVDGEWDTWSAAE